MKPINAAWASQKPSTEHIQVNASRVSEKDTIRLRHTKKKKNSITYRRKSILTIKNVKLRILKPGLSSTILPLRVSPLDNNKEF